MKKILIAPDSFKGSMTALEVCEIVEDEIKDFYPLAQVISLPIADGGEGTVDSFLASTPGEKIDTRVMGPNFEDVDSYYGLIHDGQTAIVEMAAAAGLPLVQGDKDPSKTTTYGVGQLILQAAKRGAKKLIIGLGGSASNDGGCGLAAALGIKFYDDKGQSFIPVGGNLDQIGRIDTSGLDPLIKDMEILAMCDVTNPLYGSQGAAQVFAPQKGAGPDMVKLLDDNLRHLSTHLEKLPGKEAIASLPGSGAAGGMGAGLNGLLDVPLVSGIDLILETLNFQELIKGADLLISGEGKIDGQSLDGKVISGLASFAKKEQVPFLVLAGGVLDEELEKAYEIGVSSIVSINREAREFTGDNEEARDNLRYTTRNLLGLIKALEQ